MPRNINFFPNFSSVKAKTMVLYLFKALTELTVTNTLVPFPI